MLKASMFLIAFGCMAVANTAGAYEYRLQFTPAAGYRGLVVAGYQLDDRSVVGNCSFYTVHSGSGRGGGYHTTKTYFNQTCTWDLYGALLSIAPGAPATPAPLYISGTQTVYAVNANGAYTGSDTALAPSHGFVNTPGSHYSWLMSNEYLVLQQAPSTFTATLVSDGDVAVHISALGVSAINGGAVVDRTTCIGQIPVGATCAVTLTYDPTHLRSSSGLAYDTLDLNVSSDSGQAYDFIQSYTIVLRCTGDGDDETGSCCKDGCDELASPTPTPTPTPTSTPAANVSQCPGDCSGDGTVSVNELVIGIGIALGTAPLADCPFADADRDGRVTIDDLVAVVQIALVGACPGSAAASAPD